MAQSPIYYESKTITITGSDSQLDVSDTNGIKCTWSGYVAGYQNQFSWNFDWRDLHSQGVNRLTGYIRIKERNFFSPQKMEVDWTIVDQNIKRTITVHPALQCTISFDYSLTPHYAPTKSLYDEMFSPSDMNDTVLVVEGKKIHVNKAFLSIHSDYFKVLFSNNFKEGSLSEIEIKEVSYDDFGLLCSSFYPDPQFPNDGTVEKLLILARQFLLSSVRAIVEHHLLHISKIGFQKMIWLADEFKMSKLLEKCIHELDLGKAKKLKELPEFEKLSDKTKLLILGRIMKFL